MMHGFEVGSEKFLISTLRAVDLWLVSRYLAQGRAHSNISRDSINLRFTTLKSEH